METERVDTASGAVDDTEAPVLERISANPFTLVLACVAASIFGFLGLLLTGIARFIHNPNPRFGWPMLGFSLLILLAAVRQLLWPVPLLEATGRGVRLRIASPMSRSGLFFVPWTRVRGVVLTQTVATSSRGSGREDAIGFLIDQDGGSRLPVLRWNSGTVAPQAPPCDVALPASMIRGSAAQWMRKLEAHRLRTGLAD
jgi:hypothetical protein